MAVDAHNLFLSSPQLFSNRDYIMNNNTGYCNTIQTGYDVVSSPFSLVNDTITPPLLHMYAGVDTIPTTVDSFTTYYAADAAAAAGISTLPTRKRSRENLTSSYYHHLLQNHRSSSSSSSPSCVSNTTPFSFLGQDIDISSHINQQHQEIDRFVFLHMEKVKYEIEEKRKKQTRTIMEAIELGLVKRIRVKEEESNRIGKINHELEERVKSLSVENQIWRDLAQTNEATANHLRQNLDQVLAQVNVKTENEEDDAQSCCGSSSDGGEETVTAVKEKCDMRRVVSEAHDKVAGKKKKKKSVRRMCRNCGVVESCVLLLPCRHLCLCGVCGSNVHTCPICRSPKNASVHVNMSS